VEIDRQDLLGAPVENHSRPSCQRGDSPTTGPVINVWSSVADASSFALFGPAVLTVPSLPRRPGVDEIDTLADV
jgi:hypothetical protein